MFTDSIHWIVKNDIMKNNFDELAEDHPELPEYTEMNLFSRIDTNRSIGSIFGNFFEQISGLIAMILGKKS